MPDVEIITAQKRCPSCGATKTLESFWRDRRRPNGHCGECIECLTIRGKKWRQTARAKELRKIAEEKRRLDPKRIAYRREYNQRSKTKLQNRASYKRLHSASPRYTFLAILGNKRHRGELPTHDPLTANQLMEKFHRQEGKCALSGLVMTWAPGHFGPTATSISIDKIDPGGDCTSSNTRLICHCVNSFRGRMTDEQLLVVAEQLVSHMRKMKQ